MLSPIQLNENILSAEYYFATLMDQLVDETMQLSPVDEAFICKVNELYYSIEAIRFLTNRGILTDDPTCLAVYQKMMDQLGIYTTLPDLTVDESLILINPTLNTFLENFVPYFGADQDVNLGEYGLIAGRLQLDTSPTLSTGSAGEFVWNDADGTADLILKGGNVTLQIGQEQLVRVVNKTGSNLLESQYKAVRVTGAQGQRLKVDLAKATNDLLSAETIGLVTENIDNNQEGFVTTSGLVRKINTTGSLQGETWADGDILYLSGAVDGGITTVKPSAPIHTIIIGYVVYAHNINGSIYVKVDNGYELDELHNVLISSPTNNQVLTYESATSLWKNKAPTSSGVTGSGTINYIPKFTASSIIGNSSLVDSGSGVTAGSIFNFNSSGGSDKLTLMHSGSPVVNMGVTAGSVFYAYHQASGTYPIWVNSAGRFLLGDTSDNGSTAKLQLTGSETITGTLAIGTASINASAKVQIDSTTQGFMLPRMTQAQRTAIVSPAISLMVYQTDGTEGLYMYKSTGWSYMG